MASYSNAQAHNMPSEDSSKLPKPYVCMCPNNKTMHTTSAVLYQYPWADRVNENPSADK